MSFYLKHDHLSEDPMENFIQLSKSIKKQFIAFTKKMKTSDKALEPTNLVAQIHVVAKNKEPHIIAETTLQSCCDCCLVVAIV